MEISTQHLVDLGSGTSVRVLILYKQLAGIWLYWGSNHGQQETTVLYLSE